MKLFKTEKDMAEVVVNHLIENHLDVYQEVDTKPIGGVIDIVAKQNNIIWCIECKLSLGLNVIQQAFNHTKYSNYTSIAVPCIKYRNSKIIYEILKKFNIGIMLVSYDDIYEPIRAKLVRHAYTKKYLKRLDPIQKKICNAGSKGGGYYTKFKSTKIQLIRYVKNNPGCTIQDAINNINHHYLAISTAKSSLMYWINQGIINEIEIKKNGKRNECYIKSI